MTTQLLSTLRAEQHDAIVQLTNEMTERLRQRLSCTEPEATRLAVIAVEALQDIAGGTRLGRGGLYLPVRSHRSQRDDDIRAAAGAGPCSKDTIKALATRFGVSRRTVWRAIREGRHKPVPFVP